MKIILVRHAIAEDRLVFGAQHSNDDLRPLTKKGKRRMQQGGLGLRKLEPEVDYILSSPLTRAVETADILAKIYPQASTAITRALAPGASREQLAGQLQSLPRESTVALVGHEPDLSELIAWLCTGSNFSFLRFKKGAACLLECIGQPGAASAEMQWAVTPRQLRALA